MPAKSRNPLRSIRAGSGADIPPKTQGTTNVRRSQGDSEDHGRFQLRYGARRRGEHRRHAGGRCPGRFLTASAPMPIQFGPQLPAGSSAARQVLRRQIRPMRRATQSMVDDVPHDHWAGDRESASPACGARPPCPQESPPLSLPRPRAPRVGRHSHADSVNPIFPSAQGRRCCAACPVECSNPARAPSSLAATVPGDDRGPPGPVLTASRGPDEPEAGRRGGSSSTAAAPPGIAFFGSGSHVLPARFSF